MVWAQWAVLTFNVSTFFFSVIPAMRQQKTNRMACAYAVIFFGFVLIEACAGTFSHIIGWPH